MPLPGLRVRLAWGLGLVLTGLAGLVVSALLPSLVLYLVGGSIAGAGAGLLFQSAVAVGAGASEPKHTGGTVAGVFLAAYVGITLPVVAVGVLTTWWPISATTVLFCVIVAAVMLAAARSLRRLQDA